MSVFHYGTALLFEIASYMSSVVALPGARCPIASLVLQASMSPQRHDCSSTCSISVTTFYIPSTGDT